MLEVIDEREGDAETEQRRDKRQVAHDAVVVFDNQVVGAIHLVERDEEDRYRRYSEDKDGVSELAPEKEEYEPRCCDKQDERDKRCYAKTEIAV